MSIYPNMLKLVKIRFLNLKNISRTTHAYNTRFKKVNIIKEMCISIIPSYLKPLRFNPISPNIIYLVLTFYKSLLHKLVVLNLS